MDDREQQGIVDEPPGGGEGSAPQSGDQVKNLDGSTKVRVEYGHYEGTLHGLKGREKWFLCNWELLMKRFEAKFPDKPVFGGRCLKLVDRFDSKLEMFVSFEFSAFMNSEFEVYQTRCLVSYEARSNGFKSRTNYLTKRDHPERCEDIASNDQTDRFARSLKRVVKRVRYVNPSDDEEEHNP